MTRAASLLLLLLAMACNCGRVEGASQGVASEGAALEPAALRWFDEQAGRALEGRLGTVPPDSDALVAYRFALGTSEADLADARFVPGRSDALVGLRADGQLGIQAAHGWRRIDDDVQPGFDVSAACRCVVYARGGMGEGELVRAPLDGGASMVLSTTGPVWLPVVSPEGGRVIFASSASGFPAWWIVSIDGVGERQLTNAGARSVHDLDPVAEGPERPVWIGEVVAFVAGSSTRAITSDGRRHPWRSEFHRPRWRARGEELSFERHAPTPVEQALREASAVGAPQ
jgi:hypothetical protein